MDSEVFLAGDLRIDVGQQRVTRAGVDITLPNLSFGLFLALIRDAPNLISNDVLMERVWPGQVVSPETIAKRVNLLRAVLGDNAQEPRYIAGVRGRGYRLVAAVSRPGQSSLPAEAPPRAAEAVAPADRPPAGDTAATGYRVAVARPRLRWQIALPIVLALLAAGGLGIRQLVKVRSAPAESQAGTSAPETGAIGSRARTVAVLPFDNISAEAADAYLAQGFPEMILNRLSRIEGLSVIARNSSFALPTSRIDSREIGRRLNSGYLIGGSVQREADRLRVAVHLVDSAAGTMIWSARFDRSVRDIFTIEDEVADQIAGELATHLGDRGSKPPVAARTANLDAYLAYLRGRTLLGHFTVAESEAAVPLFEKAIALDPNYAPAYASLYDARMQAADRRRQDMHQARQRYRPLIDRALELDPTLGAAYFARAMWAESPFDASATADNPLVQARERDFRQGAALDPSNGRGLEAYAVFLSDILNRPRESRSVLNRALWVDPMSPGPHFTEADSSLFEGGTDAYRQMMRQVLELDPNFLPALNRTAQSLWIVDGKLAEAIRVFEHAIALDPDNSIVRHNAMSVYLDLGEVTAARDVAARIPPGPREEGALALHQGDWRRAGLAAYDEKSWASDFNDGDICEFWQGVALRDYALKTGDLKRAMAFMRLKYFFGNNAAAHLDVCNFRDAVYLSQLLAAAGEADQARALRHAVSAWNDATEARYQADSHQVRATVLLLDDQRDAALAELAKSFRSGFYVQWRYTLNDDPLWLPLHDDARFRAIAADVRRYIDAQRAELEALRQRGEVPRRGGAVTAH